MGNLINKFGIDKNGHPYKRMVRPDGQQGSANDRSDRIPAPSIRTADLGKHTLQSSEKVLQSIPKKDRGNITPDQLDAVFKIMQRFGTSSEDSYGFRRYFASNDRHHEWSERGHGARLTHEFDRDGNVRDIHLYSLTNGPDETDYPRYYRAQAELRKVFGLKDYNDTEISYLAKKYFDSQILPTLGNIPKEGALQLRDQYVRDIENQPEIIHDILDELEKNPRIEVGNLETFVQTFAYNRNGDTTNPDKFVALVESGKFNEASRMIDSLGLDRDKKQPLIRKLDVLKKEAAKAKREAKKASKIEGV